MHGHGGDLDTTPINMSGDHTCTSQQELADFLLETTLVQGRREQRQAPSTPSIRRHSSFEDSASSSRYQHEHSPDSGAGRSPSSWHGPTTASLIDRDEETPSPFSSEFAPVVLPPDRYNQHHNQVPAPPPPRGYVLPPTGAGPQHHHLHWTNPGLEVRTPASTRSRAPRPGGPTATSGRGYGSRAGGVHYRSAPPGSIGSPMQETPASIRENYHHPSAYNHLNNGFDPWSTTSNDPNAANRGGAQPPPLDYDGVLLPNRRSPPEYRRPPPPPFPPHQHHAQMPMATLPCVPLSWIQLYQCRPRADDHISIQRSWLERVLRHTHPASPLRMPPAPSFSTPAKSKSATTTTNNNNNNNKTSNSKKNRDASNNNKL